MREAKITKKTALVIALISISQLLVGQMDTVFHSYYQTAGYLVKPGNNLIFNSSTLSNSFTSPNYVYGARNGKVTFQHSIIKHETTEIHDMLATPNGRAVYIGWAHGCDYMDSTQFNFITCIDTLGNTLFDWKFKDWNSVHFGQLDVFKQVKQHPNGTFYVLTDTTLFHLDQGGLMLSKTIIPTGSTAFCITPRNTFVLTRSDYFGYKGLSEIDTSGNIIRQDTCTTQFTKIVNGTNCYYARANNGCIWQFDTLLAKITDTRPQQGAHSITDLDFQNDTLFCSGYHGDSLSVLLFNASLTAISIFDAPYTFVIPQKIVASPGSLFLFSNEQLISGRNPAVSINEMYKYNNSFNINKDVGVTNLHLDTAYRTYYTSGMVTYYTDHYRMKVTVKNFGVNTINSFMLNHKPNASLICGVEYYHQYFPTTLLPGQSTVITTPIISSDAGACMCPLPTSNYSVSIPGVCFWTSAPDLHSDANNLNNAVCDTVNYVVTVGIDELTTDPEVVTVYPNPFEDEVILHYTGKSGATFSFYTIDGKSLNVKGALTGMQTKIPLEDLPRGIYFVLIRFEDGSARTLRLLK